jgi:HD-GYP domain-containing protein (c-di-GMP phosphodiesterase class II)
VTERLLRARLLSVLLVVAACASLPAAVIHFVGNPAEEAPIGYLAHFLSIAAASLVAGTAAVAVTVVGARRADGRAVLVGTAFAVMTALVAVHGLATEDVLIHGHAGVSAFAGAAALPVGGAVLALSALAPLRRPRNVRALILLEVLLLTVVLVLGVVGIALPDSVPAVPETGGTAAVIVLLAGLVFFGALAVRAVRTWVLTRRLADFLVVVGTVWLGVALVPMLLHTPWGWTWWIAHGLELAGIALVGGSVALDLHRGAQSRPLTGDLRAADLVATEEAFLGTRVRALMVRLAEKDAYSEGHTRRVATRAVQVGERLSLSAGRLRSLAIGGLLHDIGKLSVPDTILKKPGPLSSDERAVIARHPEWGERLVEELGGFPGEVRRLVLDHHERLDGSGYPRALDARRLDLETRILAVCDVFDALISERVYRPAWTEDRAMALLREEAGTAFDPVCVEALTRVLEGERRLAAAA